MPLLCAHARMQGGVHVVAFGLWCLVLSQVPELKDFYWIVGIVAAATLLVAVGHWSSFHQSRLLWSTAALITTALWVRESVEGPPLPLNPCKISQPTTSRLFAVTVDSPISRHHDGHSLQQAVAVGLTAEHCQHGWQPQQGRVKIWLPPLPKLNRGMRLYVRLLLSPLPPSLNPGDLSPQQRRRQYYVSAVAKVIGAPAVIALTQGSARLAAAIDTLRQVIAERCEATLPFAEAALVKALALGDKGDVSPQQQEAFARLGISHLLAVSGLHVGLVTWLCRWLLFRLWSCCRPGDNGMGYRVAAGGAIVAALSYCVLTGAQVPALRASFMAISALLGAMLTPWLSTYGSFGLAGWLILLSYPAGLYDIGFLLSFAAVAALLWWPQLPLAQWLQQLPRRWWWQKLATTLLNLFAMSVWVSIVTFPILAHAFGWLSLIAPIVNVIAVPWGAMLATPCALLHAAIAVLAPSWIWLTQPLVHGSVGGLDWGANALANAPNWQHLWTIHVLPPSRLQELLLIAIAVGVLAWSSTAAKYARWTAVLASIALSLTFVPLGKKTELVLRQVYVGQGDATWLTLPGGGTMLVDGGGQVFQQGHFSRDPGQYILAPLLRRAGVRQIDLMVMTHPHPDHYGGLLYLAAHFPVRTLWWNGTGSNNPQVRALLAIVQHHGGQVVGLSGLNKPLLWQGVEIKLLQPLAQAVKPLSANDSSMVLQLRYGQRSALLTGDIQYPAEQILAACWQPIDILKVAHHGSRNSSGLAFLQAVRPDLAVISCGRDNSYGFPHQEVINRLAALHIPSLRTDQDGMITLITDGRTWRRSRPDSAHRL